METVLVERQESPLGRWTHGSWVPSPGTQLYGHVHRIWYFDGVLLARRERIFPDGKIEIIVQLDEPHAPGGEGPAQRFPPVCVTGLRLRPEVVVAPPGRCRVMGLILAPPFAHMALRESLSSLTGLTADLHDFLGSQASELAERIDVTRDPALAIGIAQSWLVERLARAGHARGTFRETFGTTPKRYGRLLRFRAALEALSKERGSLADIAGAYGYYDQAHFSNEFREFSGLTPSAYLRANAFPAGISLAES